MQIPDSVYLGMIKNAVENHTTGDVTFNRVQLGIILGNAYKNGYDKGVKATHLKGIEEQPK